MPSGVRGNTSTNWIGASPNGRRRRRVGAEGVTHAIGQPVDDAEHHLEFVVRLVRLAQPEPLLELREHVDVGPGLADGVDDGPDHLQADWPVRPREIVLLEERGGRQHDVGVARRVGHHLVEDDRRQIVALEALPHEVLVRDRRERIAVVDEEHLHGRVDRSGQHAAEVIHVDERASAARRRRSRTS